MSQPETGHQPTLRRIDRPCDALDYGVVVAEEPSVLRGAAVLVVDDHEPHRTLLENYLTAIGCTCVVAGGGLEALKQLSAQTFDFVLLDLRMDDLDGMEVLKRARGQGVTCPTIMMSAEGTISHAVDAIRLGAQDFLVKPFELDQLHQSAARVVGARRGSNASGPDPRTVWRDNYAPNLIGEHPSLLDVFLVLERISGTDCTVLITGESGTGKELVARALHRASARSDAPYVPVNCGAIPETLIESELFGHSKGAFSGATQSREGRFAAADRGTLFLDEIGEMSLAVQVKFLRVLQEQEYVPVGETRPRKCDVRILAATNKPLEQMSKNGTFREDLFYRLNLIPIQLPRLRDRRSDIPRLTHYFLGRDKNSHPQRACDIAERALTLMQSYAWPGNVRELENVVERMVLLHQGSGTLDIDDLPDNIRGETRSPAGGSVNEPSTPPKTSPVLPPVMLRQRAPSGSSEADGPVAFRLPESGLNLRATVEAFETSLIDQALERTGGNRNQASILLGMNRTTLVEKLRKRKRKVGT